jgi:hypothetical protein
MFPALQLRAQNAQVEKNRIVFTQKDHPTTTVRPFLTSTLVEHTNDLVRVHFILHAPTNAYQQGSLNTYGPEVWKGFRLRYGKQEIMLNEYNVYRNNTGYGSPISYTLLIDKTSFSASAYDSVRQLVLHMADSKRSEDLMAVYVLNSGVQGGELWLNERASDAEKIALHLKEPHPSRKPMMGADLVGLTVHTTTSYMARVRHYDPVPQQYARQVLIVISQDADRSTNSHLFQLLYAVRTNPGTLHLVQLGNTAKSGYFSYAVKALGGTHEIVHDSLSMYSAAYQLTHDLTTDYVVEYRPPQAGVHRLYADVTLADTSVNNYAVVRKPAPPKAKPQRQSITTPDPLPRFPKGVEIIIKSPPPAETKKPEQSQF